tara:strand:+ start:1726 stop:2364 length:639 start_codon:yes stop_codon:yes gene_type:complete
MDGNIKIESFEKDKFIFVKNLISKELANYLYKYTLLKEKCVMRMISVGMLHHQNSLGGMTDAQVPKSFGSYGDFAMEVLLDDCTKKIEKITNLDLIPTNSFFRIYKHQNYLEKHIDRPSCEISATICLGYDYGKVHENYKWGMFVNDKEIFTDVGDAIIYRGCEIEHSRNVFEGLNQSQVFLHYNDLKGPFRGSNLYDKRPHLGLPIEFKEK